MPIMTAKLVVVTGKNSPQIDTLDELSSKEIYINPVSLSYKLLKERSQQLKEAGRPEMRSFRLFEVVFDTSCLLVNR
jgi:hypothetical protein